jgi:hypothetical protein
MTNANVFDQRIFQNIFAVFSLWKYRTARNENKLNYIMCSYQVF